jgi:hypothetical protein
VGRGTFSHRCVISSNGWRISLLNDTIVRHAMLVDQQTENVIVPLNNLSQTNKLELANSSLSEMAVLGVSGSVWLGVAVYVMYRFSSSGE